MTGRYFGTDRRCLALTPTEHSIAALCPVIVDSACEWKEVRCVCFLFCSVFGESGLSGQNS